MSTKKSKKSAVPLTTLTTKHFINGLPANKKKTPTKLARTGTMEATIADAQKILKSKSGGTPRKTRTSKAVKPNVSTRAVNTLSTAKEGAALLTKMKRKSTGGAKADTGKKRRLNSLERTAAEGARWLVSSGKRRRTSRLTRIK